MVQRREILQWHQTWMIYLDLKHPDAFSIPPVWPFESYYSHGPVQEIEITTQENSVKLQ